HDDAQLRNVRPEKLVQNLACEARLRENQRLRGDVFCCYDIQFCEGILSAHHQHDTVTINGLNLETWRLDWQRHHAQVNRAVFDALQNLVAKVTINADLHVWEFGVKPRKYLRQYIKAGRLVGADRYDSTRHCRLIGYGAD